MIVRYSTDDLARLFEPRTIARGRTLVLTGGVEVQKQDNGLVGMIVDAHRRLATSLTPVLQGSRVLLRGRCDCRQTACVHLAATALAGLDHFADLRRPVQPSLFERMTGATSASAPLSAETAAQPLRNGYYLSPGQPPFACFVATIRDAASGGRLESTSPRKILQDPASSDCDRAIARLLGSGDATRIGIAAADMDKVAGLLLESQTAKWMPTGKLLRRGDDRAFARNAVPDLPPKSAVLLGEPTHWYVDAQSGELGRIRVPPVGVAAHRPLPPANGTQTMIRPQLRRGLKPTVTEQVIIERPMTARLKLMPFDCPDDFGRIQRIRALWLDFDYQGAVTHADDERQFVRAESGSNLFVRRQPRPETAALDELRRDGFTQMRISDGSANGKGRRVFLFRGRDPEEQWRKFIATRLPDLEKAGWAIEMAEDFGPREVESIGAYDLRISDGDQGSFTLAMGIELDGVRENLLPILMHILDHGGIDPNRVADGHLLTHLEDGRLVRLPIDRLERLLATVRDLLEHARQSDQAYLILDRAEAPALLDLESLLATRWQNAAAIQSYLTQFRSDTPIPEVTVPAGFTATLRPYQQQGVNWLQHLRRHGLAGMLADDMGLGKTAQTIAHIAIEEVEGRLDRPVLIVVPTSLVPNWTAELRKFAPHLRQVVLHGLERHERRNRLDGVHVVITTYTVLARDIAAMREIPWHLVVLDEAQAIKSPDAKATRAVCQLDTRHKLGLSGTPIENNLGELWSEFAFLMPGLLGDRKSFAKRFRTPIEKKGDQLRQTQLAQRIRPFILRRTKSQVATELPPKHTMLRRIELAPEQRELYETIRAMLHEDVREKIAARGIAQSQIVVLDALLKLRQVCCDPRLVKLPSARAVTASSKLDDLMEMVSEMISEGRRILLFSQFTSMLDLIKPRLDEIGIRYVELRGSTIDRVEPVRSFEAGDVPLFLISLKAGGRGLNLVSADTVIHYDPWWNPAVEDQASDRAHRIGQTKPVFVYKLIAAGTVEEKIAALQARKAALADIALSGDALPAMDLEAIDYLFGPDADDIDAAPKPD